MKVIIKTVLLLLIWMQVILPLFTRACAENRDEMKLVLIHLDAVSTDFFLQELQAGNLPNIGTFFGDEGRVDNTVTYFPSKTPTIVSSIRLGKSVRELDVPGWEWLLDATDQVIVRTSNTFLRMVFSTSRISRTNIVYGIPSFHWLAAPALVNIADYLKDYPVVEFYWYNIDTQGHFAGEKGYIDQLRFFDTQFGKLARRLDPDVNVIIYSDHGMVFNEGVEIDEEVKELLGDELRIYSFPTLFIYDYSRIEEVAQKLVDSTRIDFTFYETGPFEVKGIHSSSRLTFRQDSLSEMIQYTYDHEDILGYGDLGYEGEYLTEEEWLELTYDSDFPLAPVLLFEHLKNEVSGDIITLFGHGKYQQTDYAVFGNHGGFTREELRVPLLIRGAQVSHLANRNSYHLPNLFQDINDIGFNRNPPRERHTAGSRMDFRTMQPVLEFSLSPTYRMRYGATFYHADFANLRESGRADVWGKGDLFRSYLNRVWVGGGMSFKDSVSRPYLLIEYDLHIRRLVIQNSYATHRPFEFRVNYEITPYLAVQAVNFTSLGFRFDF
ncbi:MAG: hypothetical protein EA360_03470 [Balneolaceae bacterium]|nr:MAG: hypothetical protein EA360_03470 [Balneolaceae bacterium]